MTTAVKTGSVCVECGQQFLARPGAGRPRTRCEECAPVRRAETRRKIITPRVVDQSFTVDHFLEWSSDLVLDNDEKWTPDKFFVDFVADVFSGIRECWLVVPEGNGKTTSIAGLMLYYLAHKPYAKILWAAASREQARIGYEQAEGIILRTKGLDNVFKCLYGYREIRLRSNEATKIQIYAADEKTGDGVIPTVGVLDELHRQKGLGLYRTWNGKLAKRNGQILVISTAGEPGSEFELTRELIRQHGEQTREPCFVRTVSAGVVLHDWSIPEDADPDDLEVVLAANPSPRITLETLREKHDSPTMSPSHWSRFVCNRPTRSILSAITEDEWAKSRTDLVIPDGSVVWLGMDCAFKLDTTAIVPIWESDPETRILGPAVVLVPPRNGSAMDPRKVLSALRDLSERYIVEAVVMDTSGAIDIAARIADELNITVVDRAQTN